MLLLCLSGIILYAIADTRGSEELECVTLFNFVTAFIAPTCPIEKTTTDAQKITEAIKLLAAHGFDYTQDLANVSIDFCPLQQGLGLVRQVDSILLDDGLKLGSKDTLAEVIAHEMEHVAQIRRMGEDKFKCAYIEELVACGGCVDKNHALEAPAYAIQARVRDILLKQWLEK